ncbi:peroxiredoxin family protein [Mariniblastus fucicola]|uniref:Peroxiredoxin n=1 Tax=Mariniblastus fucicola TaxID=980251 RepID=A0A5B9PBC8_9BACT|nr:peroxiredoxin family protein [Mariniblastus fucicola]QEG22300.1 Putative peroxiredoxin [Mariniblastus fucicola]
MKPETKQTRQFQAREFKSPVGILCILLAYAFLLNGWPGLSVAQDTTSPDDPLAEVLAGHSFHGSAFNEGARQSARLLGGTGKVHFDITTDSDDAQRFFNQGVGQLHGFWDLEAERSFRQVAMIDPDCAMAYWGAALATFEKPERAAGFAQEALDRIDNVSEREKQYIKALHRYFHGEKKKPKKQSKDEKEKEVENDGEKKKQEAEYELVSSSSRKDRAARYLKDLEDIVISNPDDVEAKALVVHRIWYNSRAGWPIGSYVAAESLLKEIFAANPMHPAHHYRIHLWDRRKPELSVESAGMCGLSSPSIAHMWHMPGHIFSRLNRYDDAIYYQEASARTDHRHMITDHVIPDEIHNYAHNNEWLTRNYVFLGRATDALSLAINLVELPRHPKYNAFGIDRSGSAVYGQKRLTQVLREFQMYDKLADVIDRGCFSNLDIDQDINAWRLQGCFAAITGQSEQQKQFVSSLDELMAETKKDSDEAKSLVASLKSQLESKPKKSGGEKKSDESKVDSEDDSQDDVKVVKVDKKKLGEEYKSAKKEAEKLAKRLKTIEQALKAIEGYQSVAGNDFAAAEKLLSETKGEDEAWLAELNFRGGETEGGLEALRKQVEKRKHQSIPLARLTWCLFKAGELEEAKLRFEELKTVAIGADRSVEVFSRLDSLTSAIKADSDWIVDSGIQKADTHFRPPLDSLGPVHWTPPAAPRWEVVDANNEVASSQSYAGENVLVIFYLGHGCLHCAEQLQAFGPRAKDFEDAGIKMIAISSDSHEDLSKSMESYDGELPIRLASDASLEVFKAFRAHDDFESLALHGTFLIDKQGRVRWQDISYEPFMDHEFLLNESKRLLKF